MDGQTIVQWILLGVVIAERIFERAWKLINGKNSKQSSNNNPRPCGEHGERLARLEEAAENLEKQLVRIDRRLNGLRQ